jgi:hypothetical protein
MRGQPLSEARECDGGASEPVTDHGLLSERDEDLGHPNCDLCGARLRRVGKTVLEPPIIAADDGSRFCGRYERTSRGGGDRGMPDRRSLVTHGNAGVHWREPASSGRLRVAAHALVPRMRGGMPRVCGRKANGLHARIDSRGARTPDCPPAGGASKWSRPRALLDCGDDAPQNDDRAALGPWPRTPAAAIQRTGEGCSPEHPSPSRRALAAPSASDEAAPTGRASGACSNPRCSPQGCGLHTGPLLSGQ